MEGPGVLLLGDVYTLTLKLKRLVSRVQRSAVSLVSRAVGAIACRFGRGRTLAVSLNTPSRMEAEKSNVMWEVRRTHWRGLRGRWGLRFVGGVRVSEFVGQCVCACPLLFIITEVANCSYSHGAAFGLERFRGVGTGIKAFEEYGLKTVYP